MVAIASESVSVVFVENLPENVSFSNVRSLFSPFGEIREVFISKKKSSRQKIFGFIKFLSKSDAEEAVLGLNGRSFEGFKISLNLAKYDRNKKPMVYSRREWRPVANQVFTGSAVPAFEGDEALYRAKNQGISFKDALEKGLDQTPSTKAEFDFTSQYPVCEGIINFSCIPWLQNSLVVVTKTDFSIDEVKDRLHFFKIEFSKVKSFGPNLFLISLACPELLESSFWEVFKTWCLSCFKWYPSLSMNLRIARVALRGLPWQAWSVETAANVLKNWGKVLSVVTDINEVDYLDEMVVIVLTDADQIIHGKMFCNFDFGSVLVLVEELKSVKSASKRSISLEEVQVPVETQSASINMNNICIKANNDVGDIINREEPILQRKLLCEDMPSSNSVSGPSIPPGFDFPVQCTHNCNLDASVTTGKQIKGSKGSTSKQRRNGNASWKQNGSKKGHFLRTSSSFSSSLLIGLSKKKVRKKRAIRVSGKDSADSENVLETPILSLNGDNNLLLEEECQKEALETWNVGLQLGLQAINEVEVIKNLSNLIRKEKFS